MIWWMDEAKVREIGQFVDRIEKDLKIGRLDIHFVPTTRLTWCSPEGCIVSEGSLLCTTNPPVMFIAAENPIDKIKEVLVHEFAHLVTRCSYDTDPEFIAKERELRNRYLVKHKPISYCAPARLPKILRWAGGKYKLVKELCKRIPPHRIYVEPFAGGASLFFGKTPSEVEVLADNDCRLIEFYQTIRELDSLDEILKYGWAKSRETFERLRECVRSDQCDMDDPTFRADAFLYVNKYGYGGKRGTPSFNPKVMSPKKCTAEELCGVRQIYRKWDQVRQRLRQARIECADFKTTIKKYDSPTTFFYLDPPYYEVVGEGHFQSEVQPEEVKHALDGIRGTFMLSYDDHPLIRNLFNEYRIEEVQTKYELGKAARGGESLPKQELIITNFGIRCNSINLVSTTDTTLTGDRKVRLELGLQISPRLY